MLMLSLHAAKVAAAAPSAPPALANAPRSAARLQREGDGVCAIWGEALQARPAHHPKAPAGPRPGGVAPQRQPGVVGGAGAVRTGAGLRARGGMRGWHGRGAGQGTGAGRQGSQAVPLWHRRMLQPHCSTAHLHGLACRNAADKWRGCSSNERFGQHDRCPALRRHASPLQQAGFPTAARQPPQGASHALAQVVRPISCSW